MFSSLYSRNSNDGLLLHVVDHLHELLAEVVGLFDGLGFAVDANDGLSVRLAKVNPAVREVDLYTIDVVDGGRIVFGEHLLHFNENRVNVSIRGEVDAVLGNLIVGEGVSQFADCAPFLSEARKEECNAHEGIAPVVALRIDDTTITFAADDGTYIFVVTLTSPTAAAV